ncbi:sigma-54-dependent Fis family transcriptional regulator [Stutzerimonas stutzeri]|uniref:sigma-54-dependent Fis family transcriptional regulator n=1 Tax=Stutzerimonas stutzeri TaxID=316 RepID=UPI00265B2B5B|nr:sigma-54-dependent Fis family transcriptional regulator [Stutzerimonas stutzeri]MCF6780580.1 sigma-54-dependent Fis family transcriptional regulator [Stutzerimonas stutzeri]MCF6804483.1 sigma-54-dependent Fis family transcriptional regulator [Stutzerimonas stutzeri]
MTSPLITQHAQQVFRFGQGLALPHGPAADPAIARSWRRCLDQHQLDPTRPRAPRVIEQAPLNEHRERLHQVIGVARWQMNSLHQQLGGSGQAVLLTDTRGVVIDSVASEAERPEFQRAGLWLGAVWEEAVEGTNGVGLCLVEQQALTIRRDEHFLGQHASLTCSASPVFSPSGDLLAVLNVSSAREDLSRQRRFHTMALTNLSAKLIESCFFLQHCEGKYLLRFHAQPEYIGLLSEGLLAFNGDGQITTVNETALNLLATSRAALLGQHLEAVLDIRLEDLLERSRPQPGSCWPLYTLGGQRLHGQLRGPQMRAVSGATGTVSAPVDGLCLADTRMRSDFNRALKVLERDVPVLLHGETGCGKEVFAAALHRASSRARKPFVALNCAAIPETLIESELFGYQGGSFTGARKEGMTGKLQQANGGVLFLDEIGDMPLALQTRLLRVLEEREVTPLGSTSSRVLDIRLISASHRDLQELVADGHFREDLYYRLNGLSINLPALRERTDKGALIDHLLAKEAGDDAVELDACARRALLEYPWPGNIRQLRNVLRTLVALCENGRINLSDVVALMPTHTTLHNAVKKPLDSAEREVLVATLEARQWHVGRVAEELGISRNTLYRKLRKYGITRG